MYTCDFCWVVLRILQKNTLDESQRHEASGSFSYMNVSDVTFLVCYKPRVFKIEKEILKRLYPWNSQIRYPKKTFIFQSCANENAKNPSGILFSILHNQKITMNIQKIQGIIDCYLLLLLDLAELANLLSQT